MCEIQKDRRHDAVVVDDDGDLVVGGDGVHGLPRPQHLLGHAARREVRLRHAAGVERHPADEDQRRPVEHQPPGAVAEAAREPGAVEERPHRDAERHRAHHDERQLIVLVHAMDFAGDEEEHDRREQPHAEDAPLRAPPEHRADDRAGEADRQQQEVIEAHQHALVEVPVAEKRRRAPLRYTCGHGPGLI